jgi:hypothetical protein
MPLQEPLCQFMISRQNFGIRQIRNGQYSSTALGFDRGSFIGRNIWDRRYPVVDKERGIVLSIVRFGLKAGMKSQSPATSNDRLVAEFFAIKSVWI